MIHDSPFLARPLRLSAMRGMIAAALVFAGGVAQPAPPVVEPLPSPAAAGAVTPHLAVDEQGRAHLSWLEPMAEDRWQLRFSVLEDGRWQPPRTVAEGERWFVNWADFPSVVPMGTRLVAHWLAKRPGGTYAYDVMISQSRDGGVTWTAPSSPHDDGTATEHGFVSLFPWRGEAGAIWLDGRETATADSDGGKPGHAGHRGGMTLRYALLDSNNATLEQGLVDSLVCDCCQTDAVVANGNAWIVFRNRTKREIRDIYFARLGEDGWSDPLAVASDNWRMPACPVNGPAIDAHGGSVAVAWFTAADGKARVQIAFADAHRAEFDAPIVLDSAEPLGRVDLVLTRDGAAAIWLGAPDRDGRAVLRFARVSRAGEIASESTIATVAASRRSGFPQMAMATDGLVLAWTEPGQPGRIATAIIDRASP